MGSSFPQPKGMINKGKGVLGPQRLVTQEEDTKLAHKRFKRDVEEEGISVGFLKRENSFLPDVWSSEVPGPSATLTLLQANRTQSPTTQKADSMFFFAPQIIFCCLGRRASLQELSLPWLGGSVKLKDRTCTLTLLYTHTHTSHGENTKRATSRLLLLGWPSVRASMDYPACVRQSYGLCL